MADERRGRLGSTPIIALATNHFELTATLIQRDVMRYTPSGLPVIDCVLHHESEISEAGQLRMVEVEALAVAFESVAHRLAACGLDQTYRFTGFVANRSRKSKRTVFHITQFQSIA